jgi:hypothetical protein
MVMVLLNYVAMLVLLSNPNVWCVMLILIYCGMLLLKGELMIGEMDVAMSRRLF